MTNTQQTTMKIISAGAGSGKTYRLMNEMVALLKGGVKASGIIATTFTKDAATELKERVRVKLLEEGLTEQANDLSNALIGTVHSVGKRILERFAFEAGVSPQLDIIADEDQQLIFNNALAMVLKEKKVRQLDELCSKLGLNKKEGTFDWRTYVKTITDIARANDFDEAILEKSKQLSIQSFQHFLPNPNKTTLQEAHENLKESLAETISNLENANDSTKVTQTGIEDLRQSFNKIQRENTLNWYEWVKIAKVKVGAKSKAHLENLTEFAYSHEQLPDFQADIQNFVSIIFDTAIEALNEYEAYKKRRGLIDYTDMELQVKRLLELPLVQNVLEKELELLMVDEFQDTSPIQLDIFYRLSKLADFSIWVGDPKQSIYGFRGAEPKLMQSIVDANGGIKPENILGDSWRSREDIVFATNAIFKKAFPMLPVEQIALNPKRTAEKGMNLALLHWHFKLDSESGRTNQAWLNDCIANQTRKLLESETHYILPKGEKNIRLAQAGDITILCSTNKECVGMAEALHKAGLKAAIARKGLLSTAESKLILACLKYLLHRSDTLSVAEILLLADKQNIQNIIESRLDYLDALAGEYDYNRWSQDNFYIQQLNLLRKEAIELSSSEVLNLVLEQLDLRRIIAAWGNKEQRLDNVDVIRKLALKYEDNCNRIQSAASLGGFLLYISNLEQKEVDMQSSGVSPDAVNVMTYHKSKGLEYPIVILHSLEKNTKDDVWGISLVAQSEEVDLENILANRYIRFWINPYSDQQKNTPLVDRINESPVKAQIAQNALQEEARLMYVGITRARDYLIFPTRSSGTAWLNRVFHNGNADNPAIDPNSSETFWEWNGKFLECNLETHFYGLDFEKHSIPLNTTQFLSPRKGYETHIPYFWDVQKDTFTLQPALKAQEEMIYGIPLSFTQDMNLNALFIALRGWITSDSNLGDKQLKIQQVKGVFERFDIEEPLNPNHFIESSAAFYEYLNKNLKIQKTAKKFPLSAIHQQRYFETLVDILIETDEKIIAVQHHPFAGDFKKTKQKAQEMLTWASLSKVTLENLFQNQAIEVWINFPMLGAMVKLA